MRRRLSSFRASEPSARIAALLLLVGGLPLSTLTLFLTIVMSRVIPDSEAS